MSASACVAAVILAEKELTDEQLKLTSLPSASNIILLPSGKTIWSTCERTRSHVMSLRKNNLIM